MDYNKIIIILVALLLIVIVGGVFFVSSNNAPANNVNNTVVNNTSSNISVEQVNTEEVSSQSSNTHLVIAQDGHYYICDDNGNILQNLGPSKKYYPNDPSAVDYPDAESYYPYMQNQL